MANEWMSLLPTSPVPADTAGAFLSARDAGSKYQQQAWENAGKQFIQQAIQQATTNGQTDWDKVSKITGASPYAGMAQQYATSLLSDRVNAAYNAAQKRALMKLSGVDEAAAEEPTTLPQEAAPSGVSMAESTQNLAMPGGAPSLREEDKTGFVTPDMRSEPSGYKAGATTGIEQEGGGVKVSGAGLVADPKALEGTQPPAADTMRALEAEKPKSWLGWASTVQADPFFMLGAMQGNVKQVTPDDVAALGPKERKERMLYLVSKGLLPGNTDVSKYTPEANAALAGAINRDVSNKLLATFGGAFKGSPDDLFGNLMGAVTSAPGIASESKVGEAAGGREIASGRLGLESSQLGLNRGRFGFQKERTEFQQQQRDIARAADIGVTADSQNIAPVSQLMGNVGLLHRSAQESRDLLNDPKKLKAMSDDDFANVARQRLIAIETAEKVGTEAGKESLESLYRMMPSSGALIKTYGMSPAGLTRAFETWLSAAPRAEVLRSLETTADGLAKSGVSRSSLDAYSETGRVTMPWERNWANQPVKAKATTLPPATSEDFEWNTTR